MGAAIGKFLLSALLLANVAGDAGAAGKIVGIESFDTPAWFKDSFLDINEDAAEAALAGRHLLVFFHLEDCPYCAKMLADSFAAQTGNYDFIRAHFDAVEINIRGSREVSWHGETMTEKAYARQVGVQYTPTLLFLDAVGKTILSVHGYRSPPALREALAYIQSGAYKKMPLVEYHEQSAFVYHFRTDPLLAPAADLSGLQKPLLLLVEDDGCYGCDWFYDNIFSRPEVRKQLRRLAVRRLDAKANTALVSPAGHPTTAKQFARELDLHYRPGAVFFDEEGKEIFRVTGLLNPYHFREAARYAAIGGRRAYPTFGAYLRVRRDELLAAGENVDYSIPD